MFLIHSAFFPVFGDILFLCSFFEGGILGFEWLCVDGYFEGLGLGDGEASFLFVFGASEGAH